jgi:hypothetical protein
MLNSLAAAINLGVFVSDILIYCRPAWGWTKFILRFSITVALPLAACSLFFFEFFFKNPS